jgi:hypothetical protein
MAQTRRRRRRKHRGTQGGGIDKRGRGRPRSREQARAQARRRAELRRESPPSWGTALKRGLIGAAIFGVLIVVAFGRPLGAGIALALVMLAMYVPLGYYMDRFFYRRRLAAQARAREQERAARR